jgi:4-carboxymuconolactone decarboxylase
MTEGRKMTSKRQAAIDIVSDMLSPEVAKFMENSETSGGFADELGHLALDNVFGALWARPGLSRRDRSLVTLGILIALRATEELRFHVPAALKNGLSRNEIAEVIYHSSGYAGFPAASSANMMVREVLKEP